VAKERGLAIAAAFYSATRSGDMEGLRSLLAADVVQYADGGGKRPSAKRPLIGLDDVIGFHTALARRFPQRTSRLLRYGFVNGLPGFVSDEADGLQTTALEIENDRIVGVYVMRNPDKLGHLGDGAPRRLSRPSA
jgi:RNA polymerase sigma-70 factor (ECF subfamily)